MAKRKTKNTTTQTSETTTITTPIVEEVKTNNTVDTITDTGNSAVEDAEVIKTEETKIEEVEKETEVKTTLPPVTPTPEIKETDVSTETKSGKHEIKGDQATVQLELAKKYKVKFAQSYFMKTVAATREFSLFSILETWMINRTAYIGLTSLDDFNHIKDFMLNNTITYKYRVIDATAKKQFIDKLEFNTQYAVAH